MKRLGVGLAAGMFLATAFLAPAPGAAAQPRAPEKVHGATMGPLAHRATETGGELERLKAAGLNTVSLTVWWQANEELSTIAPAEYTEPESALAKAIRSAHAAGMSVALMPMFHCSPCDSTWRGLTKPEDRDAFYEDYVGFIERYASFAEEEGVELLFLGSELTTLQSDTADWKRIAAAARAKFSGELVYDVNWDAVGGVQFWDSVDVPSISAYFPLTEEARPSVAELKAAWRNGKQKLTMGSDSYRVVEELAQKTGKKVLFGEAGYRSREFAARQPFDGTARHGEPSGEVQANAYQALLETFDAKPWWRGVLWWDWEIASANDTSFSPRGKPAEALLTRWIVQGWRPAAPAPTGKTTSPTTRRRPTTSAGATATTAPPSTDSLVTSTTSAPSDTTSSLRPQDDRDDSNAREVESAAPEIETASSSSPVMLGGAVGALSLLLSVGGLGWYGLRRRDGTKGLDPKR